MEQEIDYSVLQEDYKESFVADSEEWKQRLEVTSSIIEKTLEDLGGEEGYEAFTYNEYCIMCENNFNRLVEDYEIGYDEYEIISSKYYTDIMDYGGGDHKEAFRLAITKSVEDQLEEFYNLVNRENFIAAMKVKCGEYIGEEDVEALVDIWEKNI